MKRLYITLMMLAILAASSMPVMADPATPFLCYGGVNDTDSDPVNDPDVTVTNLNTSEIYEVEIITGSNYYQISTSSGNVSAGNVLHFVATKETTTEFDYEVTVADMNRGGFVQNITIDKLPRPDLVVTEIQAYHNNTYFAPYFNLSNEIDITVENVGLAAANESNVSLYIEDEHIGKLPVTGLGVGTTETVQFTWTPVGGDCEDGCSPATYTLKAIADCDGEVAEANETNNVSTADEAAYWAGYSADEHLNAVIHGTIQGGLSYTTGDGVYACLYYPGADPVLTEYDITLPGGADVELARLNVYYTWHQGTSTYPEMKVSIKNSSGPYSVLASDAEYNDRPCGGYPGIAFNYPYGNYVYDVTPYISGDDTYTVKVENNGTMPPPSSNFCLAAPGIVILYEDSTKPEYEYWLVEGADLLEGGRRSGAGNLGLSECISNATFTGSVDTDKMEAATLGIVSAWGGVAWGTWTSHYWFNDFYLGNGSILHGYGAQYSETIDGISMYAGSVNAQVGMNVSDVTDCILGQDNIASFGDDGDSMMAANAFLMVQYEEEVGEPVFSDNFTVPDGPNVNESKWYGAINEIGDEYEMSGRIEDNMLHHGNSICQEGPKWLWSNPSFTNGSDSPLRFRADMRILGKPGFHYHEFGFGYGMPKIYFRESPQYPGCVTPKVRGQYEGPSIPVSLDSWHTYEIVWTGTEAQWYIDGELKDTYSVSLNVPLSLVFDHGDGEYWIDNVSVWGEMFDNTPPGCAIEINAGAESTSCRIVTLTLSAEDPETGVSEMCFANEHTWYWSNWEPYNTTKTWTLSEGSGEKKVYVKYKNGAGLESEGYFDTITYIEEEEQSDLVITDVWVNWPDSSTICYNIMNIGNGTASAGHDTTLYVDETETAQDQIPVDLASGESYEGCFDDYSWTYTPVGYVGDNITVCADGSESIEELNEDNNCLTEWWRCGDVNNDGVVTVSDAIRVYRHVTYGAPLDNYWAADVDCNGVIDIDDVYAIFYGDLNCCSG